jgi:hypothetical protein
MNLLQDRRLQLAGGAGAAVLAGVAIAAFIMAKDKPPPEPAQKGALQVQLGEQAKVDPNQQLRCFVGGQFVGASTLADCAKRNGVAAQALDVGLDPSGALAAGEAPKPLAPAPPAKVAAAEAPPVLLPSAGTLGATGECLRYGAEGWRPVGGALSQSACVQALFAGNCQPEGVYGRWAGQTLRLVAGKVEASPDNRVFHTLVEQARDCSIPAF